MPPRNIAIAPNSPAPIADNHIIFLSSWADRLSSGQSERSRMNRAGKLMVVKGAVAQKTEKAAKIIATIIMNFARVFNDMGITLKSGKLEIKVWFNAKQLPVR